LKSEEGFGSDDEVALSWRWQLLCYIIV